MSYNRGKGKAAAWLREHVGHQGDGCLIWPFARNRQKGYGTFGLNGDLLYAHRFMCELVHGPAPADRPQATHSCGNGHLGCVNPRHIAWGSNSENQLERRKHGRGSEGIGSRTKLTAEQITEIRSLKGIVTQYDLAKRFGVKTGCIEYWVLAEIGHLEIQSRPLGGWGEISRLRIAIYGIYGIIATAEARQCGQCASKDLLLQGVGGGLGRYSRHP